MKNLPTTNRNGLARYAQSNHLLNEVKAVQNQIAKVRQGSGDYFDDLGDWYFIWIGSKSSSTQRSYDRTIRAFNEWRKDRGFGLLEISGYHAAAYCQHLLDLGIKKISSLQQRIRSLSGFYSRLLTVYLDRTGTSLENPFKSYILKDVIKMIERDQISTDAAAALPKKAKKISRQKVIDTARELLAEGSQRNRRDAIMLLVGYFSGRRRSEIASMMWRFVEHENDVLAITLPDTKSGTSLALLTYLSADESDVCPVRLVEAWHQEIGNQTDFIFPSIHKSGKILNKSLTGQDYYRLIKRTIGPDYSGHSTRHGHINHAYSLGASSEAIANSVGNTPSTLVKYYKDDSDRITNNSSSAIASNGRL